VTEAPSGVGPAEIEHVDAGNEGSKSIAPFEIHGGSLEREDLFAVLGFLDELAAAPGAFMSGHFVDAVEEAEQPVARDQGEGSFGEARGDRVEVGVETDTRGLVDVDGDDLIGGQWRCGQGQESRLFFGEGLRDGLIPEDGMGSGEGNVGEESPELAVAGIDVGDGPPGEEAFS
jgi:hypothetical protein